ncbi:M56 family metallopeptidase [Kitasatospora sp. NPDC097643]|uniref:M56 family metallopeptidase n=1 Tax=Kitasatospora sp. NPDC097643 TaxID=3157230 RepID=UPI0033225C56
MYFTVHLLLLAPAVLSAVGPLVARHLAPPAAVRALTCLALTAAAATVWSLSVLAFAGLVTVPAVRSRLSGDAHALAAVDPVPWGLGALAAAVLGVVTVRLSSAWRRHATGRRSLGVVRTAPAAGDLIVVADDRADAYALPGRPGRIVVTTGMLRSLCAEERAVLLAHERAHLMHHHHRYVAAAQAAVVVNPLLARLRDEIGFAVERWADEVAAEAIRSRRTALRSLARAALATACLPAPPPALAYLRHRVAARVAALQEERPVNRWHRVWPAAGAVLATFLALTDVGVALTRCLNLLVP